MKLNQTDIKRLGIYFFYDADGIVDRYVPYYLNSLKQCCTEIMVVCNGKLTPEGRKTLKEITPNLFVRENEGYDVWAYKFALEHYGWKKIDDYDEVVFTNFTIYGPLYPFSEVFNEMNGRDLDFWGISVYHKVPFDPFGTISYGYIPEHLQSSFLVVRKSMLNSNEFHYYWENMPHITSYNEAVGKHEAVFTKKFSDAGFVWEPYVKTADLGTDYPLFFESLELVSHRKCPIIKRKSYAYNYSSYLSWGLGEETVETFRYVKSHFDYDVNMIWENLLRTYNMKDVKDCLHLNFVLPKDYVLEPQCEEVSKVALFFHIYFHDEIDKCIQYAESMPLYADIYLITSSLENKKILHEKATLLAPRKVKVLNVKNRGRDVSALLVAAAPYVDKYDLICFAHDKKSSQVTPLQVGKSFAYQCFENILGSKEYVANIIHTFRKDERLGMIAPPIPVHGAYYGSLGWNHQWGPNYPLVKKLATDLELKVKIESSKEPIAPIGTMFWFRKTALKSLFSKKWEYADFPKEPNKLDGTILHAIERIYGYVVQNQGYYVAWCMNDHFAAIHITNYYYMLSELSQRALTTYGFSNFDSLIRTMDSSHNSNALAHEFW